LGRVVGVGLLAALGLFGCGSGTSSGERATSSPSRDQTAPASQPASKVTCRPFEGSQSGFQLTGSSLTRESSSVTVTWSTNNAAPPEQGAITYWAYLIHYLGDPEGDPDIQNYLVGITYGGDERPAGFSIRNYRDDTLINLAGAPSAPPPGQTLSATVPLADMPGIEKSFSWSSGLSMEGEPVSECPNGDDLVEYPD
jgi:hypothetical protein